MYPRLCSLNKYVNRAIIPTGSPLMGIELIPVAIRDNFEVHEWKHSCAILQSDFPKEWSDVMDMLHQFRLPRSWVMTPGGRKSRIASNFDSFLYDRGWEEKEFTTINDHRINFEDGLK